jgi:hypothetical protein
MLAAQSQYRKVQGYRQLPGVAKAISAEIRRHNRNQLAQAS